MGNSPDRGEHETNANSLERVTQPADKSQASSNAEQFQDDPSGLDSSPTDKGTPHYTCSNPPKVGSTQHIALNF